MTDVKHTPGPWEAIYSKRLGQWDIRYVRPYYTFREDREVALILTSLDDALDAANARLIAAAPDLLAASVRSLAIIEDFETSFKVTLKEGDLLRAAIAKAEGRS
jgi:hypothetical protein